MLILAIMFVNFLITNALDAWVNVFLLLLQHRKIALFSTWATAKSFSQLLP